LELPIAGRKHFQIHPSDEKVYKPFLRTFQHDKQKEDKPEGVKMYRNIENEDKKIYHPKRHYDPRLGFEKFPTPHYIKTFEVANKQSEKTYSLEKVIVSKRRVQSVRQQRYNIDFINPGDKPYRNPECTEGFFIEGGLIPGSSNRINFLKTVGKKSTNFYQTIDMNIKTLDPNKIWTNKVANEELSYQTEYVKHLNAWDKNLKKEAPKKIEPKGKVVPKTNVKKTANKKL
jgi:hypothetical protein